MRISANSVVLAVLAFSAVGCKGDSSTSKSEAAAQDKPVAATISVTLDGKPWATPSLGALLNLPPAMVKPSRSAPLLDVVYNLGVSRFKAIVVTDESGHQLRVGESILRDSGAKIMLVVRATGPTITVENAPSTIDAKDFGRLASFGLSNASFSQPAIDPDSDGTELVVTHGGKSTPWRSTAIAEKSSSKMRRNGKEVSVLPLTELAPTDHQGEVTLQGANAKQTLPWPPSDPIYLYVNRRGIVHALIGDDHSRHVAGSGRTDNKATAAEGGAQSNATTIREIASINFVRTGTDTPTP